MEELNLQLKQIRKMRRMSQGDLAEAVGVSSRVISAWERQETEITIKHAKKICEVLDCTFEELIGEKPSLEQLENSKQLDDLFNKLKDVDAVITVRTKLMTITRGALLSLERTLQITSSQPKLLIS